jgi:hypothetical protein
MPDPVAALDEAVNSLDRLRKRLTRSTATQVWASEELALAKATAQAWFHSHRPDVEHIKQKDMLRAIDSDYHDLLEMSGRATTRTRYKRHLKQLRRNLISIRPYAADPSNFDNKVESFKDARPDFARLIPDAKMRAILDRRWEETQACLAAGAHLAATVMMGALLEGLLLARVNRLGSASAVFTASAAPRDKKGTPLPLNKWTLKHYLDVGHELGWLRQSAMDIGVVLRDYRNYIHPAKELSHGVTIEADDSVIFWKVFTSLAEQVISSV